MSTLVAGCYHAIIIHKHTVCHFDVIIAYQLVLTRQTQQQQRQDYYKRGPGYSKSTRLGIAISPSIDDIWEHIHNV